jgi:hypothetical protein
MTSTVKYLAIVLIMACFSKIAVAQQQHLYGKVQDEKTLCGIPEANISIGGTKSGCTTNQNGEFSFYITTFPVIIIISHLGYETQQVWLDFAPAGFTILMKPVASMLKEVEIKAINEPEIFFKDERYSVLDYEVDRTLVYLLIYRFRLAKSELLCKSLDGDTIARSGTLSFIPTGLFLDCLRHVHILSQDSAYQVYVHNDTLALAYVFDILRFKSIISDCVASTDSGLIFRKESFDHQTVDFYRIDRKSSQKQSFASVSDETKIMMLRKNPADLYLLLMESIPDSNNYMIEWAWVNKILYKPNKSVLYRIGDTISVFNTTDGTIDLYDLNGKFMKGLTMAIQEKNKGNWTKEIYIDHTIHLPYTSFLKNGKLTFYQIDLNTGALTRMLTASHVFPDKPRIHNNYLFYLYDLPGTGDNKQLCRQKTGH